MHSALCWNSGVVVETRDGRTDVWYNRLVVDPAANLENVACNMFN